jgi:hypothetical protein
MADPDLTKLGPLLDLLRAKGVRTFHEDSDGNVELEFFPPMLSDPPADVEAAKDEPRCRCGHGPHEHNDEGLCLQGCDESACSPVEPEDTP